MVQRFTFPKQEKLTGETSVNELFLKGNSLMAYPMRVVWTSTQAVDLPSLKVLMSVPKKKLKHAVDRNKVKRMLREAYRHNKHELFDQVMELGLNVRIAFVWIPNEVLEYVKIERKLTEALIKMQNLLSNEATTKIDRIDD